MTVTRALAVVALDTMATYWCCKRTATPAVRLFAFWAPWIPSVSYHRSSLATTHSHTYAPLNLDRPDPLLMLLLHNLDVVSYSVHIMLAENI
jgi:hypothetical protein